MLTLFPRIKPNPTSPALLPPEPLQAPLVVMEAAADAASPVVETVTGVLNSAAAAVAAAEGPQPSNAEAATPASSVTDSDLFAAFMSGMATGNSAPFVVEITAQPSSTAAPKLLESEQQPRQSTASTPELAVSVEDLSANLPEHGSEEANTQSQGAPEQDADTVSDALPEHENSEDASTAPQLYIAAANIFDELDILHEAAIADLERAASDPQEPAIVSQLDRAAESASVSTIEVPERALDTAVTENVAIAAAPASDAQLPTTEIGSSEITASISSATTTQSTEVNAEGPNPGDQQAATISCELEFSKIEAASQEIASAQELQEPPAPLEAQQHPRALQQQPKLTSDVPSSQESQSDAPAPQELINIASPPLAESAKKAAFGAQLFPPKPKRAKGTFSVLVRVPETEVMEDSSEVEAYSSAAAQSHLDAIDDTFVAHAQLLLKGRERGRALDVGTGPGQIVIKLGYRLTRWKFIGIDRSTAMIEKARESLATAGELAGRVEFRVADGNALDFPDNAFDLVVCNSVLHHIAEPRKFFAEIARVVKPDGAILLRDLRRPSRWGYSYHAWKHGRHYAGEMRRLFMASVMAAYTEDELQKLVASSTLRNVRVFHHARTHIGFERPLARAVEKRR